MIAMQDIKRYCDAIAAAFKPQKIILFGSYAYGQPTEDSDVDVLVVMPEKKRATLDTAVKMRLHVPASFPMDIVVKGEKEVAQRLRDSDLFMQQITQQGRMMYEAQMAPTG